ncbi:RNA polymerase II subunit A C-terminal domain phosphatase-like [Mizuhopecten yessoensis]|uniref:RNA polymerase II subunit A C-terminal domain phosphatase-like n=1 Tax=Mizuhopecten yessoensis TaxID=6573 RepID=UPI000B45A272|nr:RNA polymerase II subunit A C-terminal domain phosphatase-like [Mizuhopecten yessoensis]
MESSMEVCAPRDCAIKIGKWKVRKGYKVSHGAVLCIYDTDTSKGLKIKATEVGTVVDILAKEGEFLEPGCPLLKLQSCTHPTVMKDMCADCGADLREEAGLSGDRRAPVSASVAMIHSIPELIVSEEQALELGKADEERLLKNRKLVLLVDLDQTLIHTTNDNIPANLKDVNHFKLPHGNSQMWYHTRIRPQTLHFLETVSKMYELHICTFGVRMYAHTIARFLDPEGKYFSHRILSRDECFNQNTKTANLKALFPCGDYMVCIIDDREDVWNFSPNLIHVKPYRFFQGTADINAPPGMAKTEKDSEPITHKVRRVSRSDSKEDDDNKKEAKGDSECDKDTKGDNLMSGDTEVKITSDKSEIKGHSAVEGKSVTGDNNNHVSDGSGETKECQSNCETPEQKSVEIDDTGKGEESAAAGTKAGNDKADEKKDDSQKEKKDEKADGEKEEEEGGNEEIEWDDDDDYLMYLEEILTRIHKAFYDLHDQLQNKTIKDKTESPDLKNIIPYVKRKVLKGCNIVFSGVFPTNMPPEKSRAFIVAKALGANIQTSFVPRVGNNTDATTHVVAALLGTIKVRSAQKAKGVHVVMPNWLWSCAERYEKVDERLFELTATGPSSSRNSPEVFSQKSRNSKRKAEDSDELSDEDNRKRSEKKPKTADTNDKREERFSASYNPLYSFSDDDIACMDKEVEEIMDESDGDESDEDDEERDARFRSKVLSSESAHESMSEDSMTGDFPRGWKSKGRKSTSNENSPGHEKDPADAYIEGGEESENELDKFEKTVEAFAEDSASESDSGESIGSVDDEMAAAVEREFLSQ